MTTPDSQATTPATQPEPPYRYWAFISYSSADRSWARWLQRSIESYGIPARLVDHATPTGEPVPKRFKPCFRDRSELAAGDLGAQIEEALQASRYLIVVCSPRAAASRWVDKEIASFQALGRPDRVLAVVVEGEPNAGDERECFPPALRDTEPLAADARPQGDGKRDARLKLLAGMLGVGFDVIKQRDQHRRLRRLQAIVAAVLVLAAGFAGLAGYAVVQRNEALDQRDNAVRARQQSEEVLEYLVYDLRDMLEPLARLDIVMEVQEKIEQYYEKLGVEQSDPVTLHNWAAAINGKGHLLLAKGDSEGALGEFERAFEIVQGLVNSNPGDLRWQHDLLVSHTNIGSALEEKSADARRDLRIEEAAEYEDAALQHYQESLRIAQALAPADDVGWQRALASGHTNVGGMLSLKGRWSEAMDHYRASLEILQGLVERDAQNAVLLNDLSITHDRMGEVLELDARPDEALHHYQASLEVMTSLVRSDRENLLWRHGLSGCHRNIGFFLECRDDPEGALRHYQAGLRIMRDLVELEPGNAEWKSDLTWLREHVKRCSR